MYVTSMTCVACITCVTSDMRVTCRSELNQAYLCCGSLAVPGILAVKVSMGVRYRRVHSQSFPHVLGVCTHTSVARQRAGWLCLLFWNFLPIMKPEKLLT